MNRERRGAEERGEITGAVRGQNCGEETKREEKKRTKGKEVRGKEQRGEQRSGRRREDRRGAN